jgi:two-component system response regulator HydG
MNSARILVVEDDSEMLAVLRRHLEMEGFSVRTATSGPEAIDALGREDYQVILTDLVLNNGDGIEVLGAARHQRPDARVLLMTAFGTLESAIEAIRQGAYDYLTKPFKLGEVTLAVNRALEDRRLRRENERLRAELEQEQGLGRILGESPMIRAVVEQIEAVADSDASVLLLGESGTGKELAARALHWGSSRRGEPFVAVNCGAIPENLLEAELFGHEKGAFTGADRKRQGLFAAAHRGTLFLDEVAELPVALQVKLLRAVQERSVRPVGSTTLVSVDVRLISASNRDLPSLVQQERFREDLYYRLAVVPIRLPALRERPEDLPMLAARFLERAARRLGKRLGGFSEDAALWMAAHRWPGNVRELENVVERAAVLAKGPTITRNDLGTEFALTGGQPSLRPTLDSLEQQYIERVLQETGGDKQAAARILGVSVRTLQRRVKGL